MKLSERFDLTRFAWPHTARLGPVLAWGLALGITAWVAADLFWRFSAPRPAALPLASLADPQVAAQAIVSRHLMGEAPDAGPAAAPVAVSRYALQAVVTGAAGRPGWAVISIDGGAQQGILEGEEIQPGVRLTRVDAESVELATGGLVQNLKLAERGSPPGSAAAAPGAPPAPNFGSAEAPAAEPAHRPFPAGFPAQPVSNQ